MHLRVTALFSAANVLLHLFFDSRPGNALFYSAPSEPFRKFVVLLSTRVVSHCVVTELTRDLALSATHSLRSQFSYLYTHTNTHCFFFAAPFWLIKVATVPRFRIHLRFSVAVIVKAEANENQLSWYLTDEVGVAELYRRFEL